MTQNPLQKGLLLIDDSLFELSKCSDFLMQHGIRVREKILFQPDYQDSMRLTCNPDTNVTECSSPEDLENYLLIRHEDYDGILTDLELSEIGLYSGKNILSFMKERASSAPVIIHSRIGRPAHEQGGKIILSANDERYGDSNAGIIKKCCPLEHLFIKQQLGLTSHAATIASRGTSGMEIPR